VSNQTGFIVAIVNGEKRNLASDETLLTLVATLGLTPDRLAIELDRKIVKPADWEHTAVRDGAEIEIVHFVGGG
jgi:thiamine biosynthesis protein ThiS